jgi:hypothetical protein
MVAAELALQLVADPAFAAGNQLTAPTTWRNVANGRLPPEAASANATVGFGERVESPQFEARPW